MSEFTIAEVMPRELNTMVENAMRQTGTGDANEAVRLFNSGEYILVPINHKWREEDGMIYLPTSITDGTTGPQWINRFEKRGIILSKRFKEVLDSPDFKPTNGKFLNIKVLKGMLWGDSARAAGDVFFGADERKLAKPNLEAICIICEMLSMGVLEDMGIKGIIAMHEPIYDSDADPWQLGIFCDANGLCLNAVYAGFDRNLCRHWGFAFITEEVGD